MLALGLVIGLSCLSASMTSAQRCEELGDLVVVLDSSSQVNFETWDAMIRTVQEAVYQFTISEQLTRVALVVYGNSAKLIFPFNRYFTSEEVSMAVGRLGYEPGMRANLTAALSFLETSVFLERYGARDNAPDAVLILTASQPDVQREKVFSAGSRLRRAGVRMFTVGIDGRVDRVELRAIATNPDENHFFYTPGPKSLTNLTNIISQEVCRELELCTDAADLVFILDCSGSVREEWTRSLIFARNLVDLLPVGEFNVRVAAVAYSNYAYRQFTFNSDYTRDGIKDLIDEILYHDKNTNTSGALRMTREEMFREEFGDRPGVRDVGILITDGRATWEAENLGEESRKMHEAGIQMYAIGLGPEVDVDELNMIGSDPDIAHVFMVDKAEDYVTDAIILKWSDCEIDKTYCSKYIDLVFVLDQSGSVGEGNFQRMLNFVRTLTGVLEVDSGTARVGLLLFGDRGEVLFHLNRYELGEEVGRAILEVKYGRGTTNTAAALRMVQQEMFTPENGDRPDVPNLVIVITDGASDDFGETLKEAKALKETGVTVLSLGVGNPAWLRTAELRGMASVPRSENMLQVSSFQSLDTVVQAMQDATCNETNECEGEPCQNNGVCRNGTNQYTCQCEEGFAGKDCQIACPHYYDLVLAIDASGSVGEVNFYNMLEFFSDVIGDLPFPADRGRSTRVGILTYSNDVQIEQHLNRYLDQKMIQDAIYTPYRQGTTNTAAAIRSIREDMFVEEHGDRPLVPNLAILITDGKSSDQEATWREAIKTRQAGIHLVVIGVGNSVSDLELRGIASGPDDMNIYRVGDFRSLLEIREGLVRSLCNAVNECDNSRCQNGATCIDGINTYYCICGPGFMGQYCERRSSQAMDLAFLLDTSGSIQRENFPLLIQFSKAIVNNLNVSSEAVRVAALTFSGRAKLEFTLDEYVTKYDVMHALERIYYDPGTTNTAEALKMVREELFTGKNGDRLLVPNYIIIITDGAPDDLDLTIQEAVGCRIHGVRIVVVGVGVNGQRALEYKAMASHPERKTVWSVKRISQLHTLVDAVSDSVLDDRNYCIDVNCHSGTCRPMFLSYVCDCPTPYAGKNCERRCNRQMDLALVVDVSAEAEDFPLMLDFLRGLILGLSFNYGNVRVSLVCFDKEVKLLFSLTDYTSSLEVLEAITLPRRGSGTDISSALYTIRDEVFKPDKGDRRGVPNYIILMSDGQASGPPQALGLPGNDIPDVTIFTIGIGRNINRLVLNEVSPEYLRIQTERDVREVLDSLLDHLCT